MTDDLLQGLAGIDDAKNIQVRDKTTLEVLLDAEREIIANCPNDLYTIVHNEDRFDLCNYRIAVREDLTKLPEFNEQDLKEFILANCNSDYSKNQIVALGIMSGCLINILTERNKAKGKRTRFYINGQGNKFDYLFLFANADEIIVHNFSGTYICSCITNAHKIALLSVNGYAALTYPAHFEDNRIDTLLAVGVESDYFLELWNYSSSEHTGQILKIIGIGVEGDEIICANDTTNPPDEIVLIGAWRKEQSKHTKKHPYLFGELKAKNISIVGLNYDLFPPFRERIVDEQPFELFPKVEGLLYSKNIPASLYARLFGIVYGEEHIEGTTQPTEETTSEKKSNTYQHTTYSQILKPSNLSKILREKTEDEIKRIVEQLSELTNVGQRLLG